MTIRSAFTPAQRYRRLGGEAEGIASQLRQLRSQLHAISTVDTRAARSDLTTALDMIEAVARWAEARAEQENTTP